jgi:hypothetical protein
MIPLLAMGGIAGYKAYNVWKERKKKNILLELNNRLAALRAKQPVAIIKKRIPQPRPRFTPKPRKKRVVQPTKRKKRK